LKVTTFLLSYVSLASGILKTILIYYFNCWRDVEYAFELKCDEKEGFRFWVCGFSSHCHILFLYTQLEPRRHREKKKGLGFPSKENEFWVCFVSLA